MRHRDGRPVISSNWTGDDFKSRQTVESKYTQAAEMKKNIRFYSLVSACICLFVAMLNLMIYRFRVPTMFREFKFGMIGHVVEIWLILSACSTAYFSVQGKNSTNIPIRIIAMTICIISLISFVLLIIFWSIDLKNMPWYYAFFYIAFVINLVPQVLR